MVEINKKVFCLYLTFKILKNTIIIVLIAKGTQGLPDVATYIVIKMSKSSSFVLGLCPELRIAARESRDVCLWQATVYLMIHV